MKMLRQTAIAAGFLLASLPLATMSQAQQSEATENAMAYIVSCLLYTSPSPRDRG